MNLINELRELAEDLHVNGCSRYASAMSNAADELASLQRYRTAYNEWIDKTEWMQKSLPAKYLGMHRADALKDMISELFDRLEVAEADALEQARLNGMGSEREAALMAKLEAAEKSDAESIAMYRRARDERDDLRAKIPNLTISIEYLSNLKKSYEELIGELQDERDNLRAKVERMKKMQAALRRHHEGAMGAGLDPQHSLTKLRVSTYQQTYLYATTIAALEEAK